MGKKKFKNRESKDLNNNYNHIRVEELELFKGSVEEFLNRITHRTPGYLKKKNGRTIIHLWWESKDKWFMNHGDQVISKTARTKFKGDNGWYIESDMPNIINCNLRQGYEMYFKLKK